MRVRSGHLHRHAHHFLFFHDGEQTAHQLAAVHADGVEGREMRRPAAPGKDFACPEPLTFLEISRDVIALAHALLKGLALAAGRKLQQLAGRCLLYTSKVFRKPLKFLKSV